MSSLGKILIVAGLVLTVLGLVLASGVKLPLGRLPGDIVWRRGNTTVYLPLVTCLLLSLLLTVVLWLVRR